MESSRHHLYGRPDMGEEKGCCWVNGTPINCMGELKAEFVFNLIFVVEFYFLCF